MTRHITRHLTATGGVTDVHGIPDVEMRHQLCHVGGIGIHLVAHSGLRRATVAAAIVGNDTEALA
ncbi:hypothetical protein D3C80_2059050 [compost metagenome]